LTSTQSFGRIKFHLSDFQVELRIAINKLGRFSEEMPEKPCARFAFMI
ncbi:hypothetical protein HMPREF1986_00718, partial [Oribacterium sp. oral taxon 078 str. F0263]